MSEYYTNVVKLGPIDSLPNSDKLEITDVMGGYPCILGKGEYKEGDLVSYISVDAIVDTNVPEFSFLKSSKQYHRVKARKLRGTFSMGLVVACPPGFKEGDDVSEYYGITKYVAPSEREPNNTHKLSRVAKSLETSTFDRYVYVLTSILSIITLIFLHPLILLGLIGIAFSIIYLNRRLNRKPNIQYYDIEGYRHYSHILRPYEPIVLTEKLHGCQASFIHTGRRFFTRSRTVYRNGDDMWSKVAKQYKLEKIMKKYPGLVLFGEIVGPGVQDLDYGVRKGEYKFYAFDIQNMFTRKFLDYDEFIKICDKEGIPTVPELYRGSWDKSLIYFAEGPSTLARHVREGIVIRPTIERKDSNFGRVLLKLCGEGYYTR